MRSTFLPLAIAVVGISSNAANADPTLSLYGGFQTAARSTVSVTDGTKFTAGWEGKSFSPPPYWGVRGTWWLDDFGYDNIGVSIDFSHTKVYADKDTLQHKTPGWTHFEFTDGLNLLTANMFYRFQQPGRAWTPYLGAGIGADIPHVEVFRPSGKTWNYQVGGVSGQLVAGLDYKVTQHISMFTEYKLNYSHVNVKIDSGDKLTTNLITHAIDLGFSYNF
jgi:lipid A oxidase